jgi:PAS domain S-box-containing protein
MPDHHQDPGDNFFRAAFFAIPNAVCILEPIGTDAQGASDWRYVACNDAVQQLFKIGNIVGQTLSECFPDVADKWAAEFERVITTGKVETLIRQGELHPRVYEVTLSPLVFNDRRAVMAQINDISSGYADRQSRREADARYKTLFDAIDEGFCIIELMFDDAGHGVDYRFLEANDAFVEHTGMTDAVGKRMRELQPDIEDHWSATYGRIAQSGVAERFESESPAMDRWFDVFAFPIGESAPYQVGVLFEDVGARKKMELALRHSETRLHSLIKATSDFIFRMNPDCTQAQQVDGRQLGGIAGESGNWIEAFIPEEDRAEVMQALNDAIRKREPLKIEHRVSRSDGSTGWLYSRAVPVLNDRGDITEWFGMATDITARRMVEEQLAHGAQMLRVASEIGKVGLWDWNVETGELTWSDEHYRMEGYEVGEVDPTYEIWAERIHADDRAATEAKIASAMETGDEYVNEYRVCHRDGQLRWLSARGRFLYDHKKKPVRMLGAMIDITQRRHQEEWHKLLVAELQHRVRNLIGMVRSVARLSASSHRNVDEYVDHLIGRLQAMGRTQSTLTRSPGRSVDLAELVREELLVHAARQDQCFVEGPDVALSPHAAEIVTLAIHELATNSIKYGALGDTGHIRITWSTCQKDEKTWVSFRWQETSPHRKTKNLRKGFGRRLIEERVPYELRGEGSFAVHDTGVLAQLDFPLTNGPSILETTSEKGGS